MGKLASFSQYPKDDDSFLIQGAWRYFFDDHQVQWSTELYKIVGFVADDSQLLTLETFLGLFSAEARRSFFIFQKKIFLGETPEPFLAELERFDGKKINVKIEGFLTVDRGRKYISGKISQLNETLRKLESGGSEKSWWLHFHSELSQVNVQGRMLGLTEKDVFTKYCQLMLKIPDIESCSIWRYEVENKRLFYTCHNLMLRKAAALKVEKVLADQFPNIFFGFKSDKVLVINKSTDFEAINKIVALSGRSSTDITAMAIGVFQVNFKDAGFILITKTDEETFSTDEQIAFSSICTYLSMYLTNQQLEATVDSRTQVLAKREQEMNQLVGALEDIIFELDRDGKFLSVWCSDDRLLFLPKEQIVGQYVGNFFGEHGKKIEEMIGAVWEHDLEQHYEYSIPEYGRYWFRAKIRKINDGRSDSRKVVMVVKNITESVKARHRDEQTKKAIESSAIVAVTDPDGVIIFVNETFERVSGYSKKELLGKTHKLVNSGWHDKKFFEDMWSTIKAGKVWNGEVCNRTKNGELYWVDSTINPIFNESGEIESFLAIRFEITDKKNAAVQFAHTAKMSALGEMAGGVAHEINNPLAIVLGKASYLMGLAKKGEVDSAKVYEFAAGIEKTAQRIAKTVRGLKTFARDAESDPFEPVKLLTVVDDTMELCQERLKTNNVELSIDGLDGEIIIECRATQISQVLLNLVMNSIDAIASFNEKWIKLKFELSGDTVVIRVGDCGNGIDQEIVDKLFQPFFTTKDVGKGTGLGLSISRGIIEAHGGRLFVNMQAANTEFVIELPLVQNREPKVKSVSVKISEN